MEFKGINSLIQNTGEKEFPAVMQAEHAKLIKFKGSVYCIFESVLNAFAEKLEQCNCSIDIFLSELISVNHCANFLIMLENNRNSSHIVGAAFIHEYSKLGVTYWNKVTLDLMELESELIV